MKEIVSSIKEGGEGEKPHRIVLRNLGYADKPKLVTHLETLNKEKVSEQITRYHHDGYHHGNYDYERDIIGALNNYVARCKEYGVEPNIEAQLLDE